MPLENLLLLMGGASLGFLAATLLGHRREQIARADGYHAGVREGRQWARLKKLGQEVGE